MANSNINMNIKSALHHDSSLTDLWLLDWEWEFNSSGSPCSKIFMHSLYFFQVMSIAQRLHQLLIHSAAKFQTKVISCCFTGLTPHPGHASNLSNYLKLKKSFEVNLITSQFTAASMRQCTHLHSQSNLFISLLHWQYKTKTAGSLSLS